MKQEPVAWQWLDTANFRKSISEKANKNEWRPLYTEPQYRKLTDDEIMNTFEDCLFEDGFNAIEFARVILMKASEK